MENRKTLTQILSGGSGGNNWINNNWNDIPPAPDFGSPIPPGKYTAHLRKLELFQAKKGTPGVKLHFEIIEGEHKGRLAWHDVWLTEAAKRQTVRDLGKLGIANTAKLEAPIPRWIRCLITLVVGKSDLGVEFNRVRTFEVVGIDKPETDSFATDPDQEGGPTA